MKNYLQYIAPPILHSSFLVIHFQLSSPLNDFYFSFLAKLQT